jgi:hypothetical protein
MFLGILIAFIHNVRSITGKDNDLINVTSKSF